MHLAAHHTLSSGGSRGWGLKPCVALHNATRALTQKTGTGRCLLLHLSVPKVTKHDLYVLSSIEKQEEPVPRDFSTCASCHFKLL